MSSYFLHPQIWATSVRELKEKVSCDLELSCGSNCPAALGSTVQSALTHVKGAIFQSFATSDGTVSTGVDFLGRVLLPTLGPNERAPLHVRNSRPRRAPLRRNLPSSWTLPPLDGKPW